MKDLKGAKVLETSTQKTVQGGRRAQALEPCIDCYCNHEFVGTSTTAQGCIDMCP